MSHPLNELRTKTTVVYDQKGVKFGWKQPSTLASVEGARALKATFKIARKPEFHVVITTDCGQLVIMVIEGPCLSVTTHRYGRPSRRQKG